MRMRRLPWAEEYLDKAEVVVKDPAAMKGRWREIVQGERVHLEIGCGKGDYWNLMAQKQPQDGWIAVEKNVSVAGIAVRKFDTMNNDLNRMRFIWGDAEKLDEWFAEDEIDIIHLNGSIEIAPILGLSDVIVDIVETGTTLKENNLKVLTEFMPISARFIANRASYQFKHREISTLLKKLTEVTDQ